MLRPKNKKNLMTQMISELKIDIHCMWEVEQTDGFPIEELIIKN
jgi:hypothetical protein